MIQFVRTVLLYVSCVVCSWVEKIWKWAIAISHLIIIVARKALNGTTKNAMKIGKLNMTKDPTYRIVTDEPTRSEKFTKYRKQWDLRSEPQLCAGDFPIHLDIETVATCDLKCGSSLSNPTGFCQTWTHEHVRKLGFGEGAHKKGMMEPRKFYQLVDAAKKVGVLSVKLNFRGEPSLHPEILEFVEHCSALGFVDIMMNTNGNGGARKDPELFYKLVKAGITSLNFSVDADNQPMYTKQRVGGDWRVLTNSVRSAVIARDLGLGHPDLRIRASAVRTALNRHTIDAGYFEDFWVKDMGVDWVSVSECYFPGGTSHEWQAMQWEQATAEEFQCVDPFRRMVVTWDLKHTLPCCQGFTLGVDGGDMWKYTDETQLWNCWESPHLHKLRNSHKFRTWDKDQPMCQSCPLTKKPKRLEV